jgi:hypothetical protein
MMKFSIAALVIAVFIGAVFIYTRRQNSPFRLDSAIQYRATRTLVPNHRIVAGDLAVPPGLPGDLYWRLPARPALVGHYVYRRSIQPGESVEISKLMATPDLTVDERYKRSFVYSLEGKPQLVELLDSGLKASLGQIDVEVLAVMCPQGGDPAKPLPCYAVLAVPADKAEELWKMSTIPQLIPKSF